jgi:hypothetical protein
MEFVTQEDGTRSFVGLEQVGDGDPELPSRLLGPIHGESQYSIRDGAEQPTVNEDSACSHVEVRGSSAGVVMCASKPNLPHMPRKKEDHLLKLVVCSSSIIETCDLTLTVA